MSIFEHYVFKVTLSKVFGESDLIVLLAKALEFGFVFAEELIIKWPRSLLFRLGWALELTVLRA